MKRLWPCLAAILALSSCTGVEDFGLYWNKGFIDPALEGSWKKLGLPGQNPNDIPGPDLWRFTRNGSSYSLQGINPIDQTAEPDVIEQQQAENDRPMSARTLRIGKHLFLMQRDSWRPGGGYDPALRRSTRNAAGILDEQRRRRGLPRGQTPDGEEHQEKRRRG